MKNECIVFPEFKTNSAGVWYFAPKGDFKKGRPCKGFGCIKYAEGSVYTGDIYYDGVKFNKLGCGQQDFTRSNIGYIISFINEKRYKYVGRYDYRKNDWIYGNGVTYYTDADGKPTHFRKGFFSGLDKIGDYKGEFDYSTLLDGYTPEMEFDFDEREAYVNGILDKLKKTASEKGKVSALFIGDSYFDLYANEEYAGGNIFGKVFPADCINGGIGGSTFADWIGYFGSVSGAAQPEKVLINLGFNDLHSGKPPKMVHADYVKFLKLLRQSFPQTEIRLLQVVHAPDFPTYYGAENEFNALTAGSAEKLGVKVVSWGNRLEESGVNCFHGDNVHLNSAGYALFTQTIKEVLEE